MSCRSKVCNPGGGAVVGDWLAEKVSPAVKECVKELHVDNNALRKVMALFLSNIERGLKRATHENAIIKCFPTYVQDLPKGTEEGKYLALDLGGTNFRVLLVELHSGKCNLNSDVYAISNDLMVGTGDALFDYIAQCLADFVKKHNLQGTLLPLGFTFSFPVIQTGLRSGILRRWTKGFNIPEVVNQDAVQLLCKAIDKRGDLQIDVSAILNDTTGTLMSCAFDHPDCRIGMIVGTGHNACYYETQKNAEMFDEPDLGSGRVIINLEAAAFGEDGCLDFIMTHIDKEIDNNTPNPGKQVYEKIISGMYLGELVRLYALKVVKSGDLFGGKHADIFGQKEIFPTAMISEVESDPEGGYVKISHVLRDIGITDASEQDMIDLRYICQAVSRRSAFLVASNCCVLMKKVGERKISIGIDGSLYKHHPLFRELMLHKMAELADPGFEYNLVLSEDGSGKGAALIAAMTVMRRSKN